MAFVPPGRERIYGVQVKLSHIEVFEGLVNELRLSGGLG
jgi:hypothetical protein